MDATGLLGLRGLARRVPPLRRLVDERDALRRRVRELEAQPKPPPPVPPPPPPLPDSPPPPPAARALPTAHMIDVLWCDRHGVYLKGWAHAHVHPVRRVVLASGDARVEVDGFHERPDILTHYPEHAHVAHTGFAAYLPCAPFQPVTLTIVTDAGEAVLPVEVPPHLRDPAPAGPPGDPGMDLFRGRMRERRGTVLEVGVRCVGTMTSPWAERFEPECRFIGCDIHPGPGVDLVADVHHLSDHVAPGSLDGVFSVAVLEHLAAPWLAAAEINRCLKPGGLTFHVVPQTWPVHETPNDFWRISDEGARVLFGPATGFEVEMLFMRGAMATHPEPGNRRGGWLELPVGACFGETAIVARKVADLEPGAVRWPANRGALEALSKLYPE